MGWVNRFTHDPIDALTDNKLTNNPVGVAALATGAFMPAVWGISGLATGAGEGLAAGADALGGIGATGATGVGAADTGLGGLAAAGAGDAATAGLGSMAIDSSIPTVVVHGGLGATSGVGGLGSYVGGAGALLGANQLTNNLSTNVGDLSDMNPTIGESDLPGWTDPTANPMPEITNADVTGGGSSLGLPGSNWLNLLKNGQGILNGAAGLAGAYNDYHKNVADQQYYQSLLDQMTHMYAPGSPEANLIKQQLDAKDAAAGRNSQYGARAVQLAGTLAQQRANIMTSPAFVNLAEASRGHYDNSLNGLFATLGQGAGGGNNGSGGGGFLNNIAGAINSGSNIIKGIGSLSSIFGG